MHYFSIRGSYYDKAGETTLGSEATGIGNTPGLIEYFAAFEKIFNENANGLIGYEQFIFVKYLEHFMLVRFQDRFTKAEDAKNRLYKRLELHFFSENENPSWYNIYSFIKLNKLKQIGVGEKIQFDFSPSILEPKKSSASDSLKDIISCAIQNRPYYTSINSFSLLDIMELMNNYHPIGELAFVAYNVNKNNFIIENQVNIYVSDENGKFEKNQDNHLLIDEYILRIESSVHLMKIPQRLKQHKEYQKRLSILFQFEYCKCALSDQLLDTYNENKLSFLFNLCNALFDVALFMIDNAFKEDLVKNMHLYYETNKTLVNNVNNHCISQLKFIQISAFSALLINVNNIPKAFNEYEHLFKFNRAAFLDAISEIVRKNVEIAEEYKDRTIDALLENKNNYKLLEKLYPFSAEQSNRIFENIHDQEFFVLENIFQHIKGIENIGVKIKPSELNKINFIRNKVLADNKILFSILANLYENSHVNTLKTLVFEIDINNIEFAKGDLKRYKKLFLQNSKEELLFKKLNDVKNKSFFQKWRLNRQQITTIKRENKIVAKAFNFLYLIISVLSLFLIGTIWFFIARTNNLRDEILIQSNQIINLQDSLQLINQNMVSNTNNALGDSIILQLNPTPNSELQDGDLSYINRQIHKNMPIKEIVDLIFKKNPGDIRSHYKEQQDIYTSELIKRNKDCFGLQNSFICDTLNHIPSYKKN